MRPVQTALRLLLLAAAPLLAAAVAFAAPPPAAPAGTGFKPDFFQGAKLVADSARKGRTYTFRSLLYKKDGLRLRLELSSPFTGAEAARWTGKRLDVYRNLVAPYKLDYESAVEREVSLAKAFRGEIIPSGGCPEQGLAVFPADAGLVPVTSAAGKVSYMGLAGLFYSPAASLLTEAVLYFPAAGFDRAKGLEVFKAAFCR